VSREKNKKGRKEKTKNEVTKKLEICPKCKKVTGQGFKDAVTRLLESKSELAIPENVCSCRKKKGKARQKKGGKKRWKRNQQGKP
jgi:hypothetical protein